MAKMGYAYRISRLLFKWLNRRSQRRGVQWERFSKILSDWMPSLRIQHNLYPKPLSMTQAGSRDGVTLQVRFCEGGEVPVHRDARCYSPKTTSQATNTKAYMKSEYTIAPPNHRSNHAHISIRLPQMQSPTKIAGLHGLPHGCGFISSLRATCAGKLVQASGSSNSDFPL